MTAPDTAGAETAPDDADAAAVLPDVADAADGEAGADAPDEQAADVGADVADTTSETDSAADVTAATCTCGDGVCSGTCGETPATCAADCKGCGNGVCEPGEGPKTCAIDCCGACGDGLCKGYDCGESPQTCPLDCGTACGNHVCNKGESPQSCPMDCSWQACGNGVCEPTDGGPVGCPQDCAASCGDGKCANGEDFITCPIDCGYCGDGYCTLNLGESQVNCPVDCKGGECDPGLPSDVTKCDDLNPCTNDACLPSGNCKHTPLAGGCDDGSACTIGDHCVFGTCQGAGLADCDDSNPCTSDHCAADLGCTHTPTSGACDDGNKCTIADACALGACAGESKGCDDSNPCTADSCDPVSGSCVHAPLDSSCTDDDVCTVGDSCIAGNCVPGALANCNDGNDCTTDSCNYATGCVHKDNVAWCSDGDNCTVFDSCGQGACSGTVRYCDDGNVCTDDACNIASGCVNLPNVVTCDTDGNACSVQDCQAGTCTLLTTISCNDGNPCTIDTCNAKTGACVFSSAGTDGGYCDADGSVCTVQDHCSGGACLPGPQLTCTDGNPCTDDGCDSQKGCTHLNNTASCDADGNLCTAGDACQNGVCAAGKAVACTDNNPCTLDKCSPSTGLCSFDGQPFNGQACDADGSVCTLSDSCQTGTCTPGAAMNCDDANPCTTDACAATTGCSHTLNTALCDDGDGCTVGDHCGNGACAGSPRDCNDQNLCTDDGCSANQCSHANNTVPCDDSDACTVGDACGGGGCVSGVKLNCNDGNLCTDDACGGNTCTHAANTAGCDDGDPCSTGDVCSGGVCAGAGTLNCDDQNACTNDSCQNGACKHVANNAPCDDANPCTVADYCAAGGCIGTAMWCNDGNACTNDSCAGGACVHANSTAACDDGVSCTTGDHCQDGACVPTGDHCPCTSAAQCADNDACTLDACNLVSGLCENTPAVCNDQNDCTTDKCNAISGLCEFTNDDTLLPDLVCAPDPCSTVAAQCKAGVAACALTGAIANKEGLACGANALCKSAICIGNQAPTVVSTAFAGSPVKAGASAALSVTVSDPNSSASQGTDDIASVVVDASSIGGGSAVPLNLSAPGSTDHSAVYSGSFPTTGLSEGAYLLPVVATDKSGAKGTSLAPLYVYTGNLIRVGPTETFTTIKAGIVAAVDGDAVVIDDGTYTGNGNKSLVIAGKKILVMGQNSAQKTILDCQGNLRAFNLNDTGETAQTVIANLTIQNCVAGAIRMNSDVAGLWIGPTIVSCVFATNSNSETGGAIEALGNTNFTISLSDFHGNSTAGNGYAGGAMYVHGGTVAIANSSFTSNSGREGGAVCVDAGGTLSLSDTAFTSNQGRSGGAVYVGQSTVSALRTSFQLNKAYSDGSGAGDAGALVTVASNVSLTACTISQNTSNANSAAASFNGGGTIAVDSCTFDNNSGSGTRGPIYCEMPSGSWTKTVFSNNAGYNNQGGALCLEGGGSHAMTDCTFLNNTVTNYDGGALWNNTNLTLLRCTFTNNHCGRWGGAIYNQGYSVSVSDSTFQQNSSGSSCGAMNVNAYATLQNTRFIQNSSGSVGGALCTNGATVAGCVFDQNQAADSGGGYWLSENTVDLRDTVFSNNSAKNNGGGIAVGAGTETNPFYVGTFHNLLFHHNKANQGGGLWLQLTGYYNNKAAGILGLDLRNLTVVDNTAVQGGGIYIDATASRIDSSIIWGNTATGNASPLANQLWVNANSADVGVSIQRTLMADGSNDIADDGSKVNQQTFYGGDAFGNLDGDPLFVAGTLGNYYLAQVGAGQAVTSPAVDSGPAGSRTAADAGLDARTTSTGDGADVGIVDFGFHYARQCVGGEQLIAGTCTPLVTAIDIDTGALTPAFQPTVTAYAAAATANTTATVSASAAPGVQLSLSVNSGPPIPMVGSATASLLFGVNTLQVIAAIPGGGGTTFTLSVLRTTHSETYFKPVTTAGDDKGFGEAVAMDGDTLVVGAPWDDSCGTGVNADPTALWCNYSGAVYVFVRSGGAWSQQAYIKPAATTYGDLFGNALALQGDTLVVGAQYEDSAASGINGDQTDNSLSNAGAAFVFVRSGGVWTQQAYLKSPNPNADDNFGNAVAISGDTVLVGCYLEDSNAIGVNGNSADNSIQDAGAAFVFVRSGATWSQQAYLKSTSPDVSDLFGSNVALDGDTAVIGAVYEDSRSGGVNGTAGDNSGSNCGAANVFVRTGGTWTQQAYLKAVSPQNNDYFGNSVAISGNRIVVGAPGASRQQATNMEWTVGAVFTFNRTGSVWTAAAPLWSWVDGSQFGAAVALSGDTLLVGAYANASNATGLNGDWHNGSLGSAGAAWLYAWGSGTWHETAFLKANQANASDQFGAAVALSGQTVIVGAGWEDGSSTGVGGDFTKLGISNAGACYVFE